MAIRAAAAADFPRIAAIYAFEVLNRTATFELEPPLVDELKRRHAEIIRRNLPWVVAVADGTVVGFAYAGMFRTRPAYDFTVEDSIYIEPAWQRRGFGRALLAHIIRASTAVGCRQMLALIGDSQNASSIGLHQAMGFTHAGVFRSVGCKFGRWLDVVMMQLALGDGATTFPKSRADQPPPAL